MIHVIATISLNENSKDAFINIFKSNIPNVLTEAGCIEYQPTLDANSDIEAQSSNINQVVIIEKWESLEHLKAHLVAPHMLSFRQQVESLVANVELKILENA